MATDQNPITDGRHFIDEKTLNGGICPMVESSTVVYPRKTYLQKLSLVDKKRENRMISILAGPFRFFSYPVVVYAGLMYGANGFVWSGVLMVWCPECHSRNSIY